MVRFELEFFFRAQCSRILIFIWFSGFTDKNSDSGDATSISSSEYSTNSIKCSRSLSCDSISPLSNGLSNELSTPEKARKYVGTTIKMKSTLKKFLRFNNKEDEKTDKQTAVVTPRKRIEIIHPLDLNKSSIEILRPQGASDTPDDAQKVCVPFVKISAFFSTHS